jgi:hypothetical protein
MFYHVFSQDLDVMECTTLSAALDAYREARGRKRLYLETDDNHLELLEDTQTPTVWP